MGSVPCCITLASTAPIGVGAETGKGRGDISAAKEMIIFGEFVRVGKFNRIALLVGTASVGAALLPIIAHAQVWQSGPDSGNYNSSTNWTTNTVPDTAGEMATFANNGNNNITVTAGPISPQSWTFAPNSQGYGISGQAVNFVTGITNNNALGSPINISNNMTGSTIVQAGASTLGISGTNVFTSTSVTAGQLFIGGSLTTTLTQTSGGTSNSGTINGSVAISGGAAANYNTITGGLTLTGGIFDQFSGLTSGGVTLTNGQVNARGGAINGAITNNANGLFQVLNGSVTSDSTFTNNSTAALQVTGGNFTGMTMVTNNSTAAMGIGVAAGRTLGATSLVNAAGATINNLGTITTTSTVNNGTITGAYAMAAGTLSGLGNTQNLSVNGGTFAPGNGTPGTSMTVTGSFVFQSAATYLVQVNPTTASFTTVSGAATLNGGTVSANYANGNYIAKRYTIVTAAGGVTGTFGSVTSNNLPANMNSSLSYDVNNAYLDLNLNFGLPGTLNQNQQAVGNALTGFFNRTGGIPVAFATLTAPQLTQAAGELGTGSQQTTIDAMTQFVGLMTDPFITGRGDVMSSAGGTSAYADESSASAAYAARGKPRSKDERDAYAAVYRKAPVMSDSFAQRWSVWGAAYGGSQSTDGNTTAGSSNVTSRIYGIAAGADYRLSPYTLAGFALAGGGTNFSIANGLGSGRSDLFQAGGWLRHNVGAAYLTAALAYGWQDITTDRTVTIAGVDQLRAKFNANAWSGRVEGGYRVVSQGVGFTPYAAGQFTTFQLPSYAESVVSGANTFALAYGAKDVTASRSELGLRADKSFAVQDGIFTLRGRAAWAHNFNTDRSALATFQTLPGASFVVNGAGQAADAALATASAEMKWLNGFSLAGTFEGEFSNVTRSYAGKGVARFSW